MSVQSVEATAMCLTCGTARRAKARARVDGYGGWLYRDTLRCAGCGQVTRHVRSEVDSRYGGREDRLREACARTWHYLSLLEARGDVDIRWSTASWCLGSGRTEVSLQWEFANPDEPDQGCHCEGPCEAGARPAGRLIWADEVGRWVVDLDERQPLDRLHGPLERLWRDLTCGTARAGHLGLAYATS